MSQSDYAVKLIGITIVNRMLIMKRFKGIFITILLLGMLFSSSQTVEAYNREAWRMRTPATTYKFGDKAPSNSIVANGWKNGAASWKTASGLTISNNDDSVNVLDGSRETSTTLYGKMKISYTSGLVTKFSGIINTNAKDISKSNVAKSVAVHELGHAFGIGHNSGHSIMNSQRNRSTLHNPTADDKAGISAIYNIK